MRLGTTGLKHHCSWTQERGWWPIFFFWRSVDIALKHKSISENKNKNKYLARNLRFSESLLGSDAICKETNCLSREILSPALFALWNPEPMFVISLGCCGNVYFTEDFDLKWGICGRKCEVLEKNNWFEYKWAAFGKKIQKENNINCL